MSMYGAYLKERLGDDIIENEKGFATYRFVGEDTVYVIDVYVHPDFRKQGVASDFSDTIMEIGKKRGCTKMITSVVPSPNGSTNSIRAIIAYGFELDSAANGFILFKKDISK